MAFFAMAFFAAGFFVSGFLAIGFFLATGFGAALRVAPFFFFAIALVFAIGFFSADFFAGAAFFFLARAAEAARRFGARFFEGMPAMVVRRSPRWEDSRRPAFAWPYRAAREPAGRAGRRACGPRRTPR